MGNCMHKRTNGKQPVSRDVDDGKDSSEPAAQEFKVKVDGEDGMVHVVPTQSGQVLVGGSTEALPRHCEKKIAEVLATNEKAAEKVEQLNELAPMGLNLRTSKSPPYIGLLVVEVQRVVVKGKRPWVQIKCEDDKSISIKCDKPGDALLGTDLASVSAGTGVGAPGSPTGSMAFDRSSSTSSVAASGRKQLNRQITNGAESEFTWTNAKFVFVAVFSHAQMQVVVRDSGLPGLPRTMIGTASIPIHSLQQGVHEEEYALLSANNNDSEGSGRQMGTVKLSIRYEWLRGTEDSGKRFFVDKISVEPRKLKGLRVLSHISNVNHWLLSHDNVWAAVKPDHPALALRSKEELASTSMGASTAAALARPSRKGLDSVSEGEQGAEAAATNGGEKVKAAAGAKAKGGAAGSAAPGGGNQESGAKLEEQLAVKDAVQQEGDKEGVPAEKVAEDRGLESGELPPEGAGSTGLSEAREGSADSAEPVPPYMEGESGGEGNKDNSTVNPYSTLFESSVGDALGVSVTDEPAMVAYKEKMTHLLALVDERFAILEDIVQRQGQEIQELEYRLDSSSSSGGKKDGVLPYISGRFGYGLGRPASKRKVLLFARRAQDSYTEGDASKPCKIGRPGMFLGMFITDSSGVLPPVTVPEEMATVAGHYNVTALLPEDNTFAKGSLYILAPGTKCIVMDVDGTLTVGDQEVVAQFALNAVAGSLDISDKMLARKFDLKQRPHSRTLARLWAAKGYQVIYLSGRQGSFYNLTMQWLILHNYPPGPIHLTRTRSPTLPIYLSVGNFKVGYMEMLKRRGFSIYAAYGNTGTDVRAYEAAGIPKERTYMIGQAAGAGGTVKIKNWTTHLVDVVAMPDADVPVPYVDLMWADLPMYRSEAEEKKHLKMLSHHAEVLESRPSLASGTYSRMSGLSDDEDVAAKLDTDNVDDVTDEEDDSP